MTNDNSASGESVSDLLDDGSRALRFFEQFEPRYFRWVGDGKTGTPDYAELHEKYYQQNGLNEEKFTYAAGALKEVLDKAEAQHGELTRLAQGLPSIWSGQAAANALDMVATQLSTADSDINVLKKVQGEFAGSVDALRAALRHKRDVVLQVLEGDDITILEGKTPGHVDNIIEGANHFGFTTSDPQAAVGRLKNIFPGELEPGFVDSTIEYISRGVIIPGTPYMNEIEDFCRDWMVKFVAEYERLAELFLRGCSEADDFVKREYDSLNSAFADLSEKPYPCPQGTRQAPQTTTTPGSPGGAPTGMPGGAPAGAPAGMPAGMPGGAPAATTPSSTATPEDPLSTLTQMGTQLASSGLGTQLAQGLGGLVSSAGEHIGSSLEQLREEAEKQIDTDGDGAPEDPSSEHEADEENGADDGGIELDGKDYKLEIGPDGQLQLVVTGADGEPQTYKVEVGEDGRPNIVTEESGADEETPEIAGSGGQVEGSGGSPAVAPGLPAGQPAEDVEHQPQKYPETPEPEGEPEPEAGTHTEPPVPPIDTGARLAEAGPL